MSLEAHTSVDQPLIKIATAWLAAIGLGSWSDVAAMLAAVYSLCLLGEWWWRKFWRPVLEDRGVISRLRRRAEDRRDDPH